jgi:hypothetical protein
MDVPPRAAEAAKFVLRFADDCIRNLLAATSTVDSEPVQAVSKRSLQLYFKCGECYENVYTERRTNCPSFNIWMVCTALSVNFFVTLATQQYLEYHCKVIFETPCITITLLDIMHRHVLYLKNVTFRRLESARVSSHVGPNLYIHALQVEDWRIVTLFAGLCFVGFINSIGVAAVQRERLALPVGPN